MRAVLRGSPLPLEDAVEYLLQLCDGVAEAHRLGIIHRDLKPANLFLTMRANGSPCIKVLDFGIAKISDPSEAELTNEGMIGSLRYMSPEQILHSKTADWRTDIWALGMIAYEFVTGKAAFGSTSQVDLISEIMDDEPVRPSSLRPELPLAIEVIILKCLRKNREERFQSVNEVADALRSAVGLPPAHVPRIRASMASISAETMPPAVVEEKTQRGFGVTDHPPARHGVRGTFMAGGAVAAVGSVLVLTLALRRSSEGPVVPVEVPVARALATAPLASAEVSAAMPTDPEAAPNEPPAEEPSDTMVVPNVLPGKPRVEIRAQEREKQPTVEPVVSSVASAEVGPIVTPMGSASAGSVDAPVKPEGAVPPVPTKTETKVERGAGLEFD